MPCNGICSIILDWRCKKQSCMKNTLTHWFTYLEKKKIAQEALRQWRFRSLFHGSLIITPPWNRGGVIFYLRFVCVSLRVFVCVSVCVCLSGSACEQNSSRTDEPIWTWFFTEWLFTALAQTLLKLVTLGQRSWSQWRNTHFSFIILC